MPTGRHPLVSDLSENRASDGGASTLQNSAPLALAASAPNAVLDPLFQGVLEALGGYRAVRTDFSGAIHPDTIAGEEHRWRIVAAITVAHPRCAVVSVDGNVLSGGLVAAHHVSLFAAIARSFWQ